MVNAMRSLFAAIILCLASFAAAEVTIFRVSPSKTDPAITSYDEPHWIYVNRDIVVSQQHGLPQDRRQLLVFLNGTGGTAAGAEAFLNLAANLGYHVISLMYPDDVPASACGYDRDPTSFERFRMAIIQGGRASIKGDRQLFDVSQTDSIENRLSRLLVFLAQKRPRERWAQFLNDDGTIRWESIAVSGQSQGGGHAALIGIKHRLARVLCFGAPKDYSRRYNAPAAWYGDPSATPKSLFFAFNHVQDPKGCTPQELYRNLQALQLDSFGPWVDVTKVEAPFNHARILYTSWPQLVIEGEDSDAAKIAHGTALKSHNAERWTPVWTYMLTEPGQ